MFLDFGAPGMVLVVVRGDHTLVRGYGETEKATGRAGRREPNTAQLDHESFRDRVLVNLAAEGRLALTDPFSVSPPAKRSPFGARAITLLDLATHSAALPREMAHPEGNPRRLADPRGPLEMAARLPLPGRRARSPPIPMSVSICSPMRSKRRAARPIPNCCGPGYRAARHDGHGLRPDARAMRAAHDRHGFWRRRIMHRYPRHRGSGGLYSTPTTWRAGCATI